MTVQEFLKSIDREELVDSYLNYCNERITKKSKEALNKFFDNILSKEAVEDDSWIIFSLPTLDSTYFDSFVVHRKDLTKNKIDGYAYEFNKVTEVLGYSVSNACIYAYGKYKVACSILYEMTFFGYDIEEQEKKVVEESEDLKKQVEEINSGTAKLEDLDTFLAKINYKDNRTDLQKEFDTKRIRLEHKYYKNLKKLLCKLELSDK